MHDINRRPKILYIIPSLVTGGAERVVLDLMNHLDRQRFVTAAVSLFPYSGTMFEREAADAGLQVFYLSKHLGPSINVFLQLHSIIQYFRPDVIHSHLYVMHYVLPVCIWNNIPVRVHTLHNPVDIKMPERWRKLLYRGAFSAFNFQSVSISEHVRESVNKVFGSIDSPVIYNGTETNKFVSSTYNRQIWRREQHIDAGAWVYVNIARFHKQKNHVLLIEAFSDVVKRNPQALLLLIGSGPLRSDIEHRVSHLKLHNNVRFLGDRRDIESILNACDVLVSASQWEGFGITIVEAMAAGKPIVATSVGGVPELVTQGINGFLVSPQAPEQLAKAMLVLQANQELAHWMGDNGRRIARRRFDVHEMTQQYERLYIKLLARA